MSAGEGVDVGAESGGDDLCLCLPHPQKRWIGVRLEECVMLDEATGDDKLTEFPKREIENATLTDGLGRVVGMNKPDLRFASCGRARQCWLRPDWSLVI
jgi:hypothetical protein